MSIDGISKLPGISNYSNIPDQPSKAGEGKSFFQVLKQHTLDNESPETFIIRTDNGNIGSIDIVVGDNVNLTADKLCAELNSSKPYVEIRSGDLGTPGYKNIYKLV
ncbi:MAG: hypothetical protein ABH860_04850 [bacterium]